MAVLSDNDRKDIWSEFMQEESQTRALMALDKPALRAAVDAVDTWIDDNVASFLAAFPIPSATALTNKQKAKLFFAVAKQRWEVT